MVVLAAVLIGAAAWWVESSREEESPTLPEMEGAEGTPMEEAAEVKVDRETLPAPEPQFEGPAKELLLTLEARTTRFYRSPPAAEVALEILFERGEVEGYRGPKPGALPLGSVTTDAQGEARIRLSLPIDEEGGFQDGHLFLRSLSPGWQHPEPLHWHQNRRVGIGPGFDQERTLELLLMRGVEIPVRALGLPKSLYLVNNLYSLKVENLETGTTSYARFYRHQDDPGDAVVAVGQFPTKGRYRLRASSPFGVGVQRSILIDPAKPPTELTVLLQQFGTLEGILEAPPGFELRGTSLTAVHVDAAGVADPSEALGDPDTFPPRASIAEVASDGSFRFVGLAPGAYRFGWSGSSRYRDEAHRWLDSAPVTTGTKDLRLTLPLSMVRLRMADATGLEQALFGKAGPQVLVRRMPTRKGERAVEVDPFFHEEDSVYAMIPDQRYQVLVWSPRMALFETILEGPFPEGLWTLEIPLAPRPSGTLRWTGPKEDIRYEVRSMGLGLLLHSWSSGWRNHKPMEVELPVGEYRVRAIGKTDGGNHGEVGYHRSKHGVEERRVTIQEGEVTEVAFLPPQMGFLQITLHAEGQPDPDRFPHPPASLPAETTFGDGYVFHDEVTFVMRAKDRAEATALSFQKSGLGSFYMREYSLTPGSTNIPLQTFLPGTYVLETRARGFPQHDQEVVMEAGKRTQVEVVVGGS